jgi:nucleoside-diphosphate-sugar epimerase
MIYKKRILIFGSNSFIGSNIYKKMKKKKNPILLFSKKKCNFLKKKDVYKISKKINPKDIIIFIAAKAPAKNITDLSENIEMIKNFCEYFAKKKFHRIVYVSSDAVYSDQRILSEKTKMFSESYHGKMHALREFYLKSFFTERLLILRPTLTYGIGDPHNGYGPNSFIRLALKNKDIRLFGKGEEKRDHIHVSDLSNAITKLIFNDSIGEYNVASGKVISFYNLARLVIKLSKSKSKIIFQERNSPMPHLGYRSFNIKKLVNNTKSLPKLISLNISNDLKLLKKYNLEY